jgi:WD40 repeat protein
LDKSGKVCIWDALRWDGIKVEEYGTGNGEVLDGQEQITKSNLIFDFETMLTPYLSCACLDDLGRRLIACSADGSVSVWSFYTGRKLFSFPPLWSMSVPQNLLPSSSHSQSSVYSVNRIIPVSNLSGKNKMLLYVGQNKTVFVMDDVDNILDLHPDVVGYMGNGRPQVSTSRLDKTSDKNKEDESKPVKSREVSLNLFYSALNSSLFKSNLPSLAPLANAYFAKPSSLLTTLPSQALSSDFMDGNSSRRGYKFGNDDESLYNCCDMVCCFR